MNTKPKCIIVTGRPGAGKTTLAKKLGERLWMPVISRDEIKEGYVNTYGVKHDQLPPDTNGLVTDLFFGIVHQYLAGSVSVVIESAFQRQVWEARMPEILELASAWIVLCCADGVVAASRHLQRGLENPNREFYHGDQRVADYRKTGEISPPGSYSAPVFDLPTIQVSTDGEYRPGIDEIVMQIQHSGAQQGGAADALAGGYWPTKGWRASSPEAQGLQAQKIAQLLAVIEKKKLDFHSLLIIRNGYLVSETYFGPYRPDTQHNLYSVTKSFTSTLIGIALEQGFIERTDQRIVDFFPGYSFANLDGQKQAMTLEDVLTMRSGLAWDEGDPIYQEMRQSEDWVQFVLDKPVVSPPGSQFNYNSGCSHLLSAILRQATGVNPRDFAERYLFKPLGISDARWETNAAGIPVGGWGLELTPRAMAKLGYLFLRKGAWEGKQVVSEQWVKIATRQHTKTYDDMNLGYGYQWWTVPALAGYQALGRYNQMVLVIPGSDLVIATTAGMENYDGTHQLIKRYILQKAK